MKANARLQESVEFFTSLKLAIQQAKKRIWIQVMIFEISPDMELYIKLLCDAAKRGVDIHLVVDWIGERYYNDNLDGYPAFSREKRRKRKAIHAFANKMFGTLKKAGVKVTIDNVPSWVGKILPLGKRNHNKLLIIDDNAWIGGINLIVSPDKFIDFMVKLTDPNLVSTLKNYFFNKPQEDCVINCNDDYHFLIDSGKKGKSLIYYEALRLIHSAEKKIVLVSQMLPDPSLLHELHKKSKRNVKVILIISNKLHNIFTRFPFRYHYQLFQSKIKRNANFTIIHAKRKVHAKLLLIDNKEAIFGSHNFVKWNELIGIEEASFWTKDKRLIKQFEKFWKKFDTLTYV